MCSCTNLFLYILALLFPPFPVWVKKGLCSAESLINIALCCLGVVPGLLHAWYIIATTPDEWQEEVYYRRAPQQDIESGRARRVERDGGVRYIYVTQGGNASAQGHGHGQQQRLQPHGEQGMNYGAVQGSSREQHTEGAEVAPPAYHEAIKGDHKVQKP